MKTEWINSQIITFYWNFWCKKGHTHSQYILTKEWKWKHTHTTNHSSNKWVISKNKTKNKHNSCSFIAVYWNDPVSDYIIVLLATSSPISWCEKFIRRHSFSFDCNTTTEQLTHIRIRVRLIIRFRLTARLNIMNRQQKVRKAHHFSYRGK